jgi:hypothetical protein
MQAKTRKFFAGLVLLTCVIALAAWLLYIPAAKDYPSIFRPYSFPAQRLVSIYFTGSTKNTFSSAIYDPLRCQIHPLPCFLHRGYPVV